MLTLPIPFVTALLLVVLTAVLFNLRKTLSIKPPVLVLVLICSLLSALVAWRWASDARLPRMLMPIFASSLGALAWYCFHSFNRLHLIPIALVGLLTLAFPVLEFDPDWIVVALLCAYGTGLIINGINQDEFSWSKLTQVRQANHLAVLVGIWLWWMALVDLWVAWDFRTYQGQHAALIVSGAHVMMLGFIGYSTMAFVRLQMPAAAVCVDVANSAAPEFDHTEHQLIIERLTQWLVNEKAYQDVNLSLDKMARKLGLPARTVSNAINQMTENSVSQWVNSIRIEQAKTKLINTSDTVIDIMYDCGYLTKSNFNKEFKRLVGVSPTQWRQDNS